MNDAVTGLVPSSLAAWRDAAADPAAQSAIEHGDVVVCERLAFDVDARERASFDAAQTDDARKSVYVRAGADDLHGARGASDAGRVLAAMIARYAEHCHALVDALFPRYDARRHAVGTSFRPRAIGDVASGKALSWRKDDTRLHVDAFPSNPTRGDRILRVFTNVHAGTMPRTWRVGERFEAMAARFLPRAKRLPPGGAWLLHKVGITKRERSDYDHLMLQLHDLAKADLDYQRTCPQRTVAFLPGTTWICFSDQVMHAAMSGQHLCEQTYRIPLAVIGEPQASPLPILERLTHRRLA